MMAVVYDGGGVDEDDDDDGSGGDKNNNNRVDFGDDGGGNDVPGNNDNDETPFGQPSFHSLQSKDFFAENSSKASMNEYELEPFTLKGLFNAILASF